jgi:ribokinase
MHIVTLGDVMLDVIVDAPGGLRPDDDAEATITLSGGGQAANVAAWAVELGASATLIGPRSGSPSQALIDEHVRAAGVAYAGVPVDAGGTVVSIVAAGTRTMASDAGDQTWLTRVVPTDLPSDADWLHLSGYPLLRAGDASAVLQMCFEARSQDTSVSVDLASAGLISAYGPSSLVAMLDDLAPDLVFANLSEWQTLGTSLNTAHFDVVVKRGDGGAVVRRGGLTRPVAAEPAVVVDATGAGDAFAAGYLVGGIDLALSAAARCVRHHGAQPPLPA